MANCLPACLVPYLGRYQAIKVAVFPKLGGGALPASPAAVSILSQKFDREQCLAAKSLTIKVNPQFGRVDYSQLSVIPAALTLSAPEGGVPTPSPAPQLTPAC